MFLPRQLADAQLGSHLVLLVAFPPGVPPGAPPGDFSPAGNGTNLDRIFAGTSVPIIVVTFFILGRCYSRSCLIRYWGWDDSLIVIAWLSAIAIMIMGCVSTRISQLLPVARNIIFSQAILYQFCVSITKLSILCSYLRIVPPGMYRKLTWGTICIVLSAGISLVIVNTIACDNDNGQPFHRQTITCIPYTPILIASSIFHCILDAWLIVLIVPFISNLSIPRRQKIALSIILSSGILVIVANIVRTVTITLFFNFFAFAVWSSVELCVGLFCASAPATLPLLRKLFPGLMEKVMGSNSDHHHRGDGVSTQLSRIRARDQAIELSSRDGPVQIKSQGSRTTKSAERSSATPSLAKPWVAVVGGVEVDAHTGRRGSRNHIITSVEDDGTMRVTGGATLDDVVSEVSDEGSDSGSRSLDVGSRTVVAHGEEKDGHRVGYEYEHRPNDQDIERAGRNSVGSSSRSLRYDNWQIGERDVTG